MGADALSESTVFDFNFITPNTITVRTSLHSKIIKLLHEIMLKKKKDKSEAHFGSGTDIWVLQ